MNSLRCKPIKRFLIIQNESITTLQSTAMEGPMAATAPTQSQPNQIGLISQEQSKETSTKWPSFHPLINADCLSCNRRSVRGIPISFSYVYNTRASFNQTPPPPFHNKLTPHPPLPPPLNVTNTPRPAYPRQ